MRPVRFIAPAILLALAGCAALGLEPTASAPSPAAPERTAPPSRSAAAVVPLPREKPPTPPAPRPATTPRPTASPPEAAPPPAGGQPVPLTLVGLSQEETSAILGPPASESVAGAAKVWRYQTPQCRLDVQFFLDVSRNAFYALDYAAAGQEGSTAARDRCLMDIVNDRRKP